MTSRFLYYQEQSHVPLSLIRCKALAINMLCCNFHDLIQFLICILHLYTSQKSQPHIISRKLCTEVFTVIEVDHCSFSPPISNNQWQTQVPGVIIIRPWNSHNYTSSKIQNQIVFISSHQKLLFAPLSIGLAKSAPTLLFFTRIIHKVFLNSSYRYRSW